MFITPCHWLNESSSSAYCPAGGQVRHFPVNQTTRESNTTMRLATASLPEPPFARSYWAVPGQILAGFYPGDRDPVVALNKLNALLECGVTHVCNLMERTEVDHAGRRFEYYGPALWELARQRGRAMDLLQSPIRDVSVPSAAQMTTTLDAIDQVLSGGFWDEWYATFGNGWVGCWGGRGRTGTVLGCWLARHGERDALGKLADLTAAKREHFHQVPETVEQQQFVRNWRAGR